VLALVVQIECPEGTRDAFLEAIREQAAASLELEPGCLRFDVCESVNHSERFVLYEVYEDEAAWEAHPQTEHFARWRASADELGLRIERTLTRIVA
jgi:autoinducer 2-degrading protein